MAKINLDELYMVRHAGYESVVKYCQSLGLISCKYYCPTCGKEMSLKTRSKTNDKYVWFCRERSGDEPHESTRSIRSGSWFADSQQSMADILLITHFFVRKIPHNVIMDELSLSAKLVCEWKKYFRDVCTEDFLRAYEPIGGEGKIVEIDVKNFEKKKQNKKKVGKWVFGCVERDSNKCFFKVIDNKDPNTVLKVVKNCILPGTTIYSDCRKYYECLGYEGFKHQSVNFFKSSHTGIHINSIEGTWSAIKRSLSSRTVKDQFETYLGEYMWRRIHSTTEDLTKAFFEAVRIIYPPRSCDLTPEEIEDEENT